MLSRPTVLPVQPFAGYTGMICLMKQHFCCFFVLFCFFVFIFALPSCGVFIFLFLSLCFFWVFILALPSYGILFVIFLLNYNLNTLHP